MIKRIAAGSLLFSSAIALFAQAPSLSHISPSAILPGRAVEMTFVGNNLEGGAKLWTSFPAEIAPGGNGNGSAPSAGESRQVITTSPDSPVGIGAVRLATAKGVSSLQFLMIDDVPTIMESGTNVSLQAAQDIPLGTAVDGKCEELALDFYRITIAKAQELAIEVVGQRLGFETDPVLRVIDSKGRELAYCDDAPGLGVDARVKCQISQPGAYTLEVRDTRYRGGSKYRYRLRVGGTPLPSNPYLPLRAEWFEKAARDKAREQWEIEPNSTVALATPVELPAVIRGEFGRPRDRDLFSFNVQKNERWVFAGKTRSIGSACDLMMRLQKEDGTAVADANITGANEGTLTNTFSAAGRYWLMVEELNDSGGSGHVYEVRAAPLGPGFDLSIESERFDAAAGETFEIKVSCARRDYDGPVTLEVIGETEGWQVSDNVIPSKTNEATIKIALPAKIEPGAIRHFGILGYARIAGEYVEARVSTLPAIRKLLPTFLYPPETFDGWIGLGIKAPSPKKTENAPAKTSQLNLRNSTVKMRPA